MKDTKVHRNYGRAISINSKPDPVKRDTVTGVKISNQEEKNSFITIIDQALIEKKTMTEMKRRRSNSENKNLFYPFGNTKSEGNYVHITPSR